MLCGANAFNKSTVMLAVASFGCSPTWQIGRACLRRLHLQAKAEGTRGLQQPLHPRAPVNGVQKGYIFWKLPLACSNPLNGGLDLTCPKGKTNMRSFAFLVWEKRQSLRVPVCRPVWSAAPATQPHSKLGVWRILHGLSVLWMPTIETQSDATCCNATGVCNWPCFPSVPL